MPQIEVQMPQWMSAPGLTAMTPIAPSASNSRILCGKAKPSETTILPRSCSGATALAFLSNRVPIDLEYSAGA